MATALCLQTIAKPNEWRTYAGSEDSQSLLLFVTLMSRKGCSTSKHRAVELYSTTHGWRNIIATQYRWHSRKSAAYKRSYLDLVLHTLRHSSKWKPCGAGARSDE